MKRLLMVILLQSFVNSLHAQQAPPAVNKWLYVEDVVYLGQPRSVGSVPLQDGRDLQLRFGGAGKLAPEDISRWPKNKPVRIAYSAEDGAVVMDPDSEKFALIVVGLDQHPIDIMTSHCLRDADATPAMLECHQKELGFWEREMNRYYALLIAALSPAQKPAVQAAQRVWSQFRDAQRNAATAMFTEGELSKITIVIEITNVTKVQAQRLARYLLQ